MTENGCFVLSGTGSTAMHSVTTLEGVLVVQAYCSGHIQSPGRF